MVESGSKVMESVDWAAEFRLGGQQFHCNGIVLYSPAKQHCKTVKRIRNGWLILDSHTKRIANLGQYLANEAMDGWEVAGFTVVEPNLD